MGIAYVCPAAVRIDELPWQKRGLSSTSTGFGRRIPTRYKIRLASDYNVEVTKRWYRVYAYCVSNSASLFVMYRGTRRWVNEFDVEDKLAWQEKWNRGY